MSLLNDPEVSVACSACGKTVKRKVSWFKQSGRTCPHGCGATFETSEIRKGLKETEKQVKATLKKVSNMFK